MTRPEFDNKITIGNIVSIAIFAVGLVASWVQLQAKTVANSEAIIENRMEYRHAISELKTQQEQRQKDITAFWQKEWPKVVEILNEVKHLREDIAELKQKE